MDPHTILISILKVSHIVILVRVSIFQTFITSIPLRLHAALAFFLSVLNTSLSSSPLFHLSSSKWGIISFSIFPRSSPLLPYSTSIIPPPCHSYWSVREESRRTCLFINVSEGSGHWRRERSSEGGRGRGNVTKRRRKRGWKRVRARQESFHCASKLMKRLVRWPQGLLTETEQHHTRK